MEGLRLLKALLLYGPETCLADALSHIPAVRRLTTYPKGLESAGEGNNVNNNINKLEEAVVGVGDAGHAAPRIRFVAREVGAGWLRVRYFGMLYVFWYNTWEYVILACYFCTPEHVVLCVIGCLWMFQWMLVDVSGCCLVLE